jgi:DNA-binding transcriptional MerR regulator
VDKECHIREFAALTGVTVRALHHYDRVGILQPRRSSSGYRLYGRRELERLEQIVALKFIGIPLKQIKAVLSHHPSNLADALRLQRLVLEEKRRLLDHAIEAVRTAEQSFEAGGRPNAAILKQIIEVMEMQNDNQWSENYYSPAAQAKIKEQQATWTPELQARAQQDWLDLFRDVEAALNEDPASEKVQALAARWKRLVSAFTGGNPEIAQGLNRMYADRPNWPQSIQERMAPFSHPKVWEFMGRALDCTALMDGSR